MRRTLHIAAITVALAGHASAQQPSTGTSGALPSLDTLVEQLDAPGLYEREEARALLVQMPALSDERILDTLADTDTSPEARAALETILLDRFASLPVGAVGVTFDQATIDPRGVRIGATNANFPAVEQGLVREGDVIVAVDGVNFVDAGMNLTTVQGRNDVTSLIRTRVFSRIPGETIPVTLLREGVDEPIDIEMPLGNISAHGQSANPTDVRTDALRLRLARLTGVSDERSLDVPMAMSFWPQPFGREAMRLRQNPVFGAPAAQVNSFNDLDPYAPERRAPAIRNQFTSYAKHMEEQERREAIQGMAKPLVQQRVNAQANNNDAQIARLIRAELMLRDGTDEASVARAAPASHEPIVNEIVRLTNRINAYTRDLAGSSDPATRTRLEGRLADASSRLDALRTELASRLADIESLERSRRLEAERVRGNARIIIQRR
ncbi:MAG: hypothetical protein Tsb0013_14000 [Phycisphaerales bacterium]